MPAKIRLPRPPDEWLPLPFAPSLTGWRRAVGTKVNVQSPQSALLSGSERRAAWLLAEIDPGHRFVFEAVVHYQGSEEEECPFGIFWGEWGADPKGTWALIRRCREGANLQRRGNTSESLAVPVSAPVRLRLEAWDGSGRFIVDGQPVCHWSPTAQMRWQRGMMRAVENFVPLTDGLELGLATGPNETFTGGKIAISDIRIRRATSPLPAATDHEGLILYAHELLARDSADVVGHTTRSAAKIATGDLAGAEYDAQQALTLVPQLPYARYLLAAAALAGDRTDVGLAALRAIIAEHPWHGLSHRLLIETLSRANRQAEGKTALETALRVCPVDSRLEEMSKTLFRRPPKSSRRSKARNAARQGVQDEEEAGTD